MIFALLCLFSLLAAHNLDPMIEKTLNNTSIIKTKQIKIPKFPTAYNPSIIPYKNGYLLSFRIKEQFPNWEKSNYFRVDSSLLGLVKLDHEFNVLDDSLQFLDVVSYDDHFSLTAEDARLFKIGGRIFIIYNDLPLFKSFPGHAMYLGELMEVKNGFFLKEPTKPLLYSKAITVEKNWSPFIHENELYLIYSDQPRIILQVDLDTGICREIAQTELNYDWHIGRIRGGTPAALIDEQFLTFFHTRLNLEEGGFNYIMGAYLFDVTFPFSIRAIIPVPLGDLSYYTTDNKKKIVFPSGLVIDQHLIHVVWGKNDRSMYLTTFDKTKLFALMNPINLH